jgi:hypothetical protein
VDFNLYFEIGLHCVIVNFVSFDNLHYFAIEINAPTQFSWYLSSINSMNHFSLYYQLKKCTLLFYIMSLRKLMQPLEIIFHCVIFEINTLLFFVMSLLKSMQLLDFSKSFFTISSLKSTRSIIVCYIIVEINAIT